SLRRLLPRWSARSDGPSHFYTARTPRRKGGSWIPAPRSEGWRPSAGLSDRLSLAQTLHASTCHRPFLAEICQPLGRRPPPPKTPERSMYRSGPLRRPRRLYPPSRDVTDRVARG